MKLKNLIQFKLNNWLIILFFIATCLAIFVPIPINPTYLVLLLLLFLLKPLAIKIIAIFLFGFFYSSISLHQGLNDDFDYHLTNRLVKITGNINSIPKYRLTKNGALKTSFIFQTDSIENQAIKKNIYISTYDLIDIRPGQYYQFLAYLLDLENKYISDSFKNYLISEKIDFVSWEAKKASKIDPNNSDFNFLLMIENWRYYLLTKLNNLKAKEAITITNKSYQSKDKFDQQNILVTHDKVHPVIEALVLGYRGNFTSYHWDQFNNLGITHLMAISGLHVSLVVLFVFLLWQASYLLMPNLFHLLPLYKVQALSALLLLLLYILIAGYSLPTIRAGIMGVVLLVSFWQGKKVLSWRNYFLALFLIILYNPLTVLSASFWLSFYAVFIIFFILNLGFSKRQQWIFLPIILSLAIMPIQLYFFSAASVISPVANLILIPLFSLCLMPLIVLLLLSLIFNLPLASFFYYLSSQTLAISLHILEKMPDFLWQIDFFTAFHLLNFLLIFLVMLLPKGLIDKRLALILAFALAYAFLVQMGIISFV